MLYLLGLVVLFTTLFCETAARRQWLPYWVSRKILHFVAVGSCALAAVSIERNTLLPIVAAALLLLSWLVWRGKLMRDETGRPAWGILWFSLAFLVLLLGIYDTYQVAFAMSVLAVCDPAATVAGKLSGWGGYNLSGDPKTLAGSLGFVAAFLFLTILFPSIDEFFWMLLPAIAIYLATWEGLGSRGLDNLFLPLAASFIYPYLNDPTSATSAFVYLPLLSVGFGWWAVRRGSLTVGGAVATGVLATTVTVAAGILWLLPLLVFFGSSVLIGKLFPSRSSATDEKHRQPRDAVQVAANGLVYLIVAVYWQPNGGVFYSYMSPWREMLLVAAAVATADTWASELGQYFRQPTYDLLRWRRVPVGLSGGVSVAGSFAAVVGAALISGLGFLLVEWYAGKSFLFVTLCGFAGMLVDSLLGSALQARYRSTDGALSDTVFPGSTLVHGYRWMSNDLVNLLAIGLMVFFSELWFVAFG